MDVDDLISDMVLPEDVAGDDSGTGRFRNIRDAFGQDGITVVGTAIPSYEPDEALDLHWTSVEGC